MASSIKEFFEEKYEDKIYAAVNEHLKSHPDELEKRYLRLHHVRHFSLDSVKVMAVYSDRLANQEMEVEIAAQTAVDCLAENNSVEKEVHPWYSVKALVAPDLKHGFAVESVMPYVKKPHMYYAKQGSFLPEIRKDNLEEKAEEILIKYYPEALEHPMPVDPEELARRMGLILIKRRISKNGSVFGRIYFKDTTAFFYNERTGKQEIIAVKAGTIFVDPIVSARRAPGALGNTIVHECVHWYLHRDVFTHGAPIQQIEYGDTGYSRGGGWSAVDVVEWQASAVAPRMQMPVCNFRQKVAEFTAAIMKEHHTYSVLDVIEPVIVRLSKFFKVSRLSAKIRMVELGYDVARGTFIYADNSYVRPHSWKPGFLKEHQTFSVRVEDAARLLRSEPGFFNDPRSREFVYVDSHFVYNRPKYVCHTQSGMELTEYALSHMEECCLVFELELSAAAKVGPHGPMIFCLVGIAHVLDAQVLGAGSMLRTAVIFFYAANEGISITENAGRMGLPVPEKLRDVMRQLKEK